MPQNSTDGPLEGGCDCRRVRYRFLERPLFVHCCHCRWCQRESGAAFALNAMIESDRVELTSGEVLMVDTPSSSGRGQKIARCPHCFVALWSHYSGNGEKTKFVRVGTLDEPDRMPPDIHIFTSTKQPWVRLDPDTPAVAEYYDRERYWTAESLARLARALGTATVTGMTTPGETTAKSATAGVTLDAPSNASTNATTTKK